MQSANKPPVSDERQVYVAEEQWTQFFVREYSILFEVALRILWSEADAKDAVQNAFVSFDRRWRNGLSIEVQGDLGQAVRAYLIAVVKNHAWNIVRKRYRSRETEMLTEHIPGGLNPEEELLLKSSGLKQVVKQLSPELRKLFLFILKHVDRNRDEYWPLWAEENKLESNNRRARNSFDQLKRRLRQRLITLGLYELLGGKE